MQKTKQFIMYDDKYGRGIFNVSFTNNVDKAMNYSNLWILKNIALRNFKKLFPKEIQQFVSFKKYIIVR